jgi:hypothetical protein
VFEAREAREAVGGSALVHRPLVRRAIVAPFAAAVLELERYCLRREVVVGVAHTLAHLHLPEPALAELLAHYVVGRPTHARLLRHLHRRRRRRSMLRERKLEHRCDSAASEDTAADVAQIRCERPKTGCGAGRGGTHRRCVVAICTAVVARLGRARLFVHHQAVVRHRLNYSGGRCCHDGRHRPGASHGGGLRRLPGGSCDDSGRGRRVGGCRRRGRTTSRPAACALVGWGGVLSGSCTPNNTGGVPSVRTYNPHPSPRKPGVCHQSGGRLRCWQPQSHHPTRDVSSRAPCTSHPQHGRKGCRASRDAKALCVAGDDAVRASHASGNASTGPAASVSLDERKGG